MQRWLRKPTKIKQSESNHAAAAKVCATVLEATPNNLEETLRNLHVLVNRGYFRKSSLPAVYPKEAKSLAEDYPLAAMESLSHQVHDGLALRLPDQMRQIYQIYSGANLKGAMSQWTTSAANKSPAGDNRDSGSIP